jgi:hypothetical protein
MHLRAFGALALGIVMTESGYGQGVSRPDIRANVVVQSCLAVTFGSSGARWKVAENETQPLYSVGSSYSGTFLSVVANSSQVVWHEGQSHTANGIHVWARGEKLSLFIAKPVEDVCPTPIGEQLTVETEFCAVTRCLTRTGALSRTRSYKFGSSKNEGTSPAADAGEPTCATDGTGSIAKKRIGMARQRNGCIAVERHLALG